MALQSPKGVSQNMSSLVSNHTFYPFTDSLGPPTIAHISHNQTANEGDKVILNCTADGNPPPNITRTRLSSNSHVAFPLVVRRHDEGGQLLKLENSLR